jgi:formate dehydrogenase subunit gamma
MFVNTRLGALVLGAMLALPLGALAQAPAGTAPAPGTKAESGVKPPPVTAPVKPEDVKPTAPAQAAPAATSPPSPGKGSTAVPGWNNPPVWDGVSSQVQYASVPGREYNVLIQGAGREWRAFRNGPLTQAGGWILVGVLAVLLLLAIVKGKFKLHAPPTGRLIERFNAVERAAHWTMAVSFIVLALSGVVMFFGKHIILPWLGYGAFSWLTIISKNLHNFVGPLFIFSLAVSFFVFVRDNFMNGDDIRWLLRFGGMFSGNEMPSGRFNGMEKAWFWVGIVLLGITLAATGLILDFPNWNQGREAMQLSNTIHVIAAVLFIAGGLAHAYMGVMTEGAYRGMRDGYVDETWAKEHHVLWYEEVKAGKRNEKFVPGTAQPVAGDD